MAPAYALGFDIGGTFTDFVRLDLETGAVSIYKSLTDAHDPARGVLQGLRHAAEPLGVAERSQEVGVSAHRERCRHVRAESLPLLRQDVFEADQDAQDGDRGRWPDVRGLFAEVSFGTREQLGGEPRY